MTSVQRILRNSIYKGTFILNQYTSVKVGGKKSKLKLKEKWFVFPNHHPAIVDEETWEQANQKNITLRKQKLLHGMNFVN